MLNRALGQQLVDTGSPPLAVLAHALAAARAPVQQRLQRRPHNVVEEERAVDEQREADDLQPLEGFPAQAQRDDPDEEGSAGVDCGARGGADGARDGEAEEVEAARGALVGMFVGFGGLG